MIDDLTLQNFPLLSPFCPRKRQITYLKMYYEISGSISIVYVEMRLYHYSLCRQYEGDAELLLSYDVILMRLD